MDIVDSQVHLGPGGAAEMSLFASVRGGSFTSARSYSWLRYCGVYQ